MAKRKSNRLRVALPWAVKTKAMRRAAAIVALVSCGPVVESDDDETSGAQPTESSSAGEMSSITAGPTSSSATDPTADVDVDSGVSLDDGPLDTTTAGDETADPIDPIVPPVLSFELTRIVSGGPWEIVQDAGGIAVDPSERVFIADGLALYGVEDGVVTTWLSAADGPIAPSDVDVDANGVIYVLDSESRRILVVDAPHEHMELRSLEAMQTPINLGVVDADRIAVRGWGEGLWIIEPIGSASVYSDAALMGRQGCTTEDLAAQTSGVFTYQPGCNGSPLVVGNIDASGVRTAFEWDIDNAGYTNARCSTRAPGTGFYAVLEFDISTIELVYMQEDVTQYGGWAEVATTPTFAEGMQMTDEPFGFLFCGIAVSPASTLYMQTGRELWMGTPTG